MLRAFAMAWLLSGLANAAETDPAVLWVILEVKDGAGGATGGWNAAPARQAGRLRTTPRASGDGSLTDGGLAADFAASVPG